MTRIFLNTVLLVRSVCLQTYPRNCEANFVLGVQLRARVHFTVRKKEEIVHRNKRKLVNHSHTLFTEAVFIALRYMRVPHFVWCPMS